MGDVEVGRRRSTSLSPSPTNLNGENWAGPIFDAPQPRSTEFTEGQKRRLLGTLCPQLTVDEHVLEGWNMHFQTLFGLITSYHKVLRYGGSCLLLAPNAVDEAADAISSAISLVRRYPTESWRVVLGRLHPLMKRSGLETDDLATCVVYFWFHVKIDPWEFAADSGTWSHELSLVDNVASRFPSPTPRAEGSCGQTLSRHFTGPNLSRFYGIRIERTDSMDKHLILDNFDFTWIFGQSTPKGTKMILMIFCNTQALETIFTEKLDDGSPVCPLPRSLYFEVNKSFGLLFPKPSQCRTYFGGTVSIKPPILSMTAGRELNLSRYEFFNARLNRLLDIYNSPTIRWWHPLIDRRNKREHFTLWIAIWAFILGFFSLLTGLVSGIYAVKQYDLGLAAACAESGDHPRMREYCG